MREFYLDYLANVSEYLKLNKFCKICGVSPSNLSRAIKFKASTLSDEKLKLLYDSIIDYCRKIA